MRFYIGKRLPFGFYIGARLGGSGGASAPRIRGFWVGFVCLTVFFVLVAIAIANYGR